LFVGIQIQVRILFWFEAFSKPKPKYLIPKPYPTYPILLAQQPSPPALQATASPLSSRAIAQQQLPAQLPS
jgi:hypothetical protein